MKTFEQYNHTVKSAKSLILSAFEKVDSNDIDFNYVNGQLHVIVYAKDIEIDEIKVAMETLQDKEVLGDSIEIIKIKPKEYIKIVVDERMLENFS